MSNEEEIAAKMAEILASWRRAAGLTSSQIAEKMGVARSTVSRLEKNAGKAQLDTICRYAEACGVNPVRIVL